jgi:hypothetical protein
MKKNNVEKIVACLLLGGIAYVMLGCSTDENPISPDKMSELRKQEGDQRANFRPSDAKPPGQ